MPHSRHVELVRGFNRAYTQWIGLLRESFLKTSFSLTQARVLYEIAQRPGVRSADLVRSLAIDAGYLSRLLQGFEQAHLVRRSIWKHDGRVSQLSLTGAGRKAFESLNSRSDAEISKMLGNLSNQEQQELVGSMTRIQRLLGPRAEVSQHVELRMHRPGDIGWVVARHGELYAQEYGWDSRFEGLVAEIAGKFLTHFDGQRERCWIAEHNGNRVGCVFLVTQSKTVAKLRLLLVEPSTRGMGIGTKLVAECVDFARSAGYRKITLWTNDVLTAARRIYEKAGFRLVKEEKHHSFGHDLVGQFWEVKL